METIQSVKGILVIMLVIAGILAAEWFIKGSLDKKDFAMRMKSGVEKRDSTSTIKYLPQKPRIDTLHLPAKPNPESKRKIDSSFAQAQVKGSDSLEAQYEWIAQDVDTTIVFDSIGTLYHHYSPLTHIGIFMFQPYPLKEITKSYFDSIWVPMPVDHPWYRDPLLVIAAGLAGYGLHDFIKH